MATFSKLNHLLRLFNGRCIIVEDGEPRYVVISFDEYVALRQERGEEQPSEESQAMTHESIATLEELGKEMEALRQDNILIEEPAPKERGEYNIEDIPF